MSLTLHHRFQDGFLEVFLIGKVTADDYRVFGPKVERLIQEHGPLRILVDVSDCKGWTFSGLWEEIKFDVRHFNDVERLAIVGEAPWHKGLSIFCKPFTTAEVRYFDDADIEAARAWLTQREVPARQRSTKRERVNV
jgi:hypothetical protein